LVNETVMKIPSSKIQAPKKLQNPNSKCVHSSKVELLPNLEIGVWDFSGAWNLELGTSAQGSRAAFTFIELILVMCLLVVALSLVVPSLKGFFHGRNLDSEAHRFLALTRYGQSRAISDGVPMILWIDPKLRTYGLETQVGYGANEGKLKQFTLDESLQIQPQISPVGVLTQSNLWTQVRRVGGLPQIRFLPDGSISDSSPDRILISQSKEDALWITETTNHLRYEIHR
jgi:Tfp pilus assembly protein FimT